MPATEKNKHDSFMRSLCMGELEQDIIFPFPKMKKEEIETLAMIRDSLKNWLGDKGGDFRKWDRAGEFPPEYIQQMREMGVFGFIIPETFGGMGMGSSAYSRALQEVARYDGATAVTIGAHSSIGLRGLLLFGTPAQHEKYYPKLASGEMIAAFCLTEPDAGSDAAAIKTRAKKVQGGWEITGNKLWITNGGIADFFTVFARTDGEIEGGHGKMTAFIITRDMKGVSNGPHEDKMGLRASSTTTVHFDKVFVPDENVMGEVGQGFKVAMHILNSGRTGLGGGSVGAMKSLIELSTKQAKARVQFGKPISDFGLIKQKIGHMVVDCYAAESVVSMVAGIIDGGFEDYAVEAAISKVFASEALWRTADESLQLAAGNGYMCEFPYERILRDCRINRIFEGTNDILYLFIALTAVHDAGAQLKEVSKSFQNVFKDPLKGFGVLQDYALKHAKATGIQKIQLSKAHPKLKEESAIFEDAVKDLTSFVDRLLRKWGKEIIGKQFATKRLALVMVDLFVLASVISRVTASIEAKSATANHETEILKVFAGQCRRRIKGHLNKIDNNDDELIKALADHAVGMEGYVWDTL